MQGIVGPQVRDTDFPEYMSWGYIDIKFFAREGVESISQLPRSHRFDHKSAAD